MQRPGELWNAKRLYLVVFRIKSLACLSSLVLVEFSCYPRWPLDIAFWRCLNLRLSDFPSPNKYTGCTTRFWKAPRYYLSLVPSFRSSLVPLFPLCSFHRPKKMKSDNLKKNCFGFEFLHLFLWEACLKKLETWIKKYFAPPFVAPKKIKGGHSRQKKIDEIVKIEKFQHIWNPQVWGDGYVTLVREAQRPCCTYSFAGDPPPF